MDIWLYDRRTTFKVAPVPPCRTAAPARPKSCREIVSPAVSAAICMFEKALTAAAGEIIDPASAEPLRKILEDNSRAAVVLTE